MVNDPTTKELYAKQSKSEKLFTQIMTGFAISLMTMPVSVFFDRLFARQNNNIHGGVQHDVAVRRYPPPACPPNEPSSCSQSFRM
eukprot:1800068-Prymnesium_polylepis.1